MVGCRFLGYYLVQSVVPSPAGWCPLAASCFFVLGRPSSSGPVACLSRACWCGFFFRLFSDCTSSKCHCRMLTSLAPIGLELGIRHRSVPPCMLLCMGSGAGGRVGLSAAANFGSVFIWFFLVFIWLLCFSFLFPFSLFRLLFLFATLLFWSFRCAFPVSGLGCFPLYVRIFSSGRGVVVASLPFLCPRLLL